jgi:pimeloyl-ACP methyl ester carboxylesterase
MFPLLLNLCLAAAPSVETQFCEVAPEMHDAADLVRSAGENKAIVLIHGLHPHPLKPDLVNRADLHVWQRPDSYLVKRLRWEADVYAFAYSQTAPADEIAARSDFDGCILRLKKMGYREIILVGHSAGGIVARTYVEDHPTSGVSRVIQVCVPNGGSGWADWAWVPANQLDFLNSLTKTARQRSVERRNAHIPAKVEFVCIVGTGTLGGDGLVSLRCAWPDDLQAQGIPAVTLPANHWLAVRAEKGADMIAHLIRESQPRVDEAQIAATRRRIFGE